MAMGSEFHFFAPPPAQIGTVQQAHSTLRTNKIWLRHLSLLGLPFRHSLAYLGEHGFACFECDRHPGRLVTREVVVYADVANLYTRSEGSSLEFLWKDPLDRLVFRYEFGPTHPLKPLLEGAAVSWTEHVLNHASDTISRGGSVEFPILGQGLLRLGARNLTWGMTSLNREDMESFRHDESGIELLPSYTGEARGIEPLRAKAANVGNMAALVQLMTYLFELPATSQCKASS